MAASLGLNGIYTISVTYRMGVKVPLAVTGHIFIFIDSVTYNKEKLPLEIMLKWFMY